MLVITILVRDTYYLRRVFFRHTKIWNSSSRRLTPKSLSFVILPRVDSILEMWVNVIESVSNRTTFAKRR